MCVGDAEQFAFFCVFSDVTLRKQNKEWNSQDCKQKVREEKNTVYITFKTLPCPHKKVNQAKLGSILRLEERRWQSTQHVNQRALDNQKLSCIQELSLQDRSVPRYELEVAHRLIVVTTSFDVEVSR